MPGASCASVRRRTHPCAGVVRSDRGDGAAPESGRREGRPARFRSMCVTEDVLRPSAIASLDVAKSGGG